MSSAYECDWCRKIISGVPAMKIDNGSDLIMFLERAPIEDLCASCREAVVEVATRIKDASKTA